MFKCGGFQAKDFFCVKELDEQFQKYMTSYDRTERKQIAEDIQRAILESYYFVPVFRHAFVNGIGPRVAAQKWQDVFPTVTLPKLKLVGEIVRVLPPEIPVPDSGTVTLGTFEDTVSVPVKLPTLFGTNLTMKVTLLKEARLSGVVIPENLKDPVTATWEIFMVARVRLVKVRYV